MEWTSFINGLNEAKSEFEEIRIDLGTFKKNINFNILLKNCLKASFFDSLLKPTILSTLRNL